MYPFIYTHVCIYILCVCVCVCVCVELAFLRYSSDCMDISSFMSNIDDDKIKSTTKYFNAMMKCNQILRSTHYICSPFIFCFLFISMRTCIKKMYARSHANAFACTRSL